MKEKQLTDCTSALNQLVDAYGEDEAYKKIKNLLPKPDPKYWFRLSNGRKYRRWIHSVTADDNAIVIHFSEEPALISGDLNAIAEDLFYLKELKLPFSKYNSYLVMDYSDKDSLDLN